MKKNNVNSIQFIPYNKDFTKEEIMKKFELLRKQSDASNNQVSSLFFQRLIAMEKSDFNEKLFCK